MKPNAVIVLIERDADGNVAIRDAGGTVRLLAYVPSEISEVLDDETLPKTEPPKAANSSEIDAAIQHLAAQLAPEPLRPLASIGINNLFKRAQAFSTWRDANRDAYARARASRVRGPR